MLSLSSYPFHVPFSRVQNGPDGLHRSWPPQSSENNQSFSNWLTDSTESSSHVNKHNQSSHQNENGSSGEMPKPLVSAKSDPAVSDGKLSCSSYSSSMNGNDNLVMTGSSNPRAEQLSWLAEVATGSARVSQNTSPSISPGRDKDNGPLLHVAECVPPRGTLNPVLLGVNTMSQRIFAPYQGSEVFQAQQASSGGAGISLYYSQASRAATYPSFYHVDHRLPYSQVVADGLVGQTRLARPYYQQNDIYATTMANVQLPINHGHVPHSTGYLHTAARLSPIGDASSPISPHSRLTVQQNSGILLSRQSDSLLLQEQDKNLTDSSQFLREDRRKSYKSPDPKSRDSPHAENLTFVVDVSKEASSIQNTAPSQQVTYKVPTGKEGSLKHRILRPPSINIIDPPSIMLDAPLSAPPIRSHTEPSPKVFRHDNFYRSSSTSGTFVLEASQVPAQPKVSASTFLVPSAADISPDSNSNLMYPPAFMKGSIIQLADSKLKPVELMTTEDFLECESLSSNLKIDSSSVVNIEKMPSSGSVKLGFLVGRNKLQITVEAPLEHPFFVFKQGWSSCCPQRSLRRYGLTCSKLKVGDICIFLTVKSDSQSSVKSEAILAPSHVPTKKKIERVGFVKIETTDHAKPLVNPETSHLPSHEDSENCDISGTARKRKRRWSAPSEVTCDSEQSTDK